MNVGNYKWIVLEVKLKLVLFFVYVYIEFWYNLMNIGILVLEVWFFLIDYLEFFGLYNIICYWILMFFVILVIYDIDGVMKD